MAAEDPFAADYRHPPEALAMALDRALPRHQNDLRTAKANPHRLVRRLNFNNGMSSRHAIDGLVCVHVNLFAIQRRQHHESRLIFRHAHGQEPARKILRKLNRVGVGRRSDPVKGCVASDDHNGYRESYRDRASVAASRGPTWILR